ncbi:MAG TPA: hypothetical protein VFQ53_04405 [Kofleriaceae bacterium]|nr:hypothetical protein [Kofleriaceae bacterium]
MTAVRISIFVVATSTGCFVAQMPKKVPEVNAPKLAPDAFIDVHTDVATESRGYTERSDVCSGGSDCVQIRTHKRKNVLVNTATATVDGAPVTIGQVAMATSPEFVADDARLRSATSHCRRGRLVMMAGGLGLTAAYFLLNAGLGANPKDPALTAGGIAAGGGGLAVMALGRFALGGQDCGTAEKLFDKWSGVYEDPSSTEVREDRAKLLEALVEKFHHDHPRAQQATTDDAPASTDEQPEETP